MSFDAGIIIAVIVAFISVITFAVSAFITLRTKRIEEERRYLQRLQEEKLLKMRELQELALKERPHPEIHSLQQQVQEKQSKLEEQSKLLEMQAKNVDLAVQTANKIIDSLYPNADAETRQKLLSSVLANLLDLDNTKMSLPTSMQKEKETKST